MVRQLWKALLQFIKHYFKTVKNIYFAVNVSKVKLVAQRTLYPCIKIHLFNVYLCKEADLLLIIVCEIILSNINHLLPTRVSICQLPTVFVF